MPQKRITLWYSTPPSKSVANLEICKLWLDSPIIDHGYLSDTDVKPTRKARTRQYVALLFVSCQCHEEARRDGA